MKTQRRLPELASRCDRQSAPALPDDPFGIYIHIPFCTHICPYCDFNTFAGQESRIPAYVEAIHRELALWAPRFEGRQAASIFFGGGTPSLLTPGLIAATIGHCRKTFDFAREAEITIEANPNDLDQDYCEFLLEAGVNRLSIGAQTLDRKGLRVLGRLHDADQVGNAMSAARQAGFDNVSLDFIFGWPGQTLETWRSDLQRVLSGSVGDSRPDHLSLYGLIVEPGTPMADAVARGILTPVDEERSADFLDLANSLLAAHGWTHYEIDNWAARPDRVSRHNTIYWRNGDYAGIGAGAHGHVGEMRTMNQPSPRRYIDALGAGKSPVTNIEVIEEPTAMGETMMLGLRLLQKGVAMDAFHRRHHVSMDDAYGPVIARLESLGLLSSDGTRILLTERGAMLANSVCAEFL